MGVSVDALINELINVLVTQNLILSEGVLSLCIVATILS